ncbi:MAG: SDR family oxidoreductase [Calditerrivibrio sp.]|nr:SDR family oxidoreductase [Calditerrivibrio sp.]
MKNIFIVGSTGFVGRRVLKELLKYDNISISLLVRNRSKVGISLQSNIRIYEGDILDSNILDKSLDGVDVAIYLVHMMGETEEYLEMEKKSAETFLESCIKKNVKRIIYLGGLGKKETASKHLLSRYLTGEILCSRPDIIKTIWFRAGVIIGSGSASFEIIRNIVEKLPAMVAPKWVKNKTSPIYIDDVVKYIVGAVFTDKDIHGQVDIGMPPMSFKDMVLKTAEVMGLKRYILTVPVLSPRLSSYWLILFTPVNFMIARELIMGLKSESIKIDNKAEEYFPEILVTGFNDAVNKSLFEIENDQVISRWCDSSKGKYCDVPLVSDVAKAVYVDRYFTTFDEKYSEKLFDVCKSVGGETGWFSLDFLWWIRGVLDKLVGGYGLNRGRRSNTDLRVGDVIDFWKVIDIVEGKRLLLEAQMKLPGKAWLEFSIIDNQFSQTAYFYPKGLWGRFYWYSMLPFHKIIFNMMMKNIIKRASDE